MALMGLFESLRLPSDCFLCGCSVGSHKKQIEPHSRTFISQTAQPVKRQSLSFAPIICQFCHQHLPFSNDTCISCGLPLTSKQLVPCGECLKNSPPYNRTLSAFHYEAPISDFITQLKYSAQLQLLPLLCDYLINKILQSYNDSRLPNKILAVPLHPTKQVQRGFNQSQLIALQIAKALGIDIINKGIHRIKQTQAQPGLDSIERKKNMKNAFLIDCKLPEHIAIVDDVVTTGMTVSELAKQARLRGAKQIDVWCIARAYGL